jgi:hypothetical protein
MYSLVMIVCMNISGECISIAPEPIFSSKNECQEGFSIVLDAFRDDITLQIMDAQCVSWDTKS